LRPKIVAGLAGAISRFRAQGIVPDMDQRPFPRAPKRKQPNQSIVRCGIVAFAPSGIVNGLLKINQQQNRAVRWFGGGWLIGGAYVATRLSGANRLAESGGA